MIASLSLAFTIIAIQGQSSYAGDSLLIGAFNVRTFGVTKMGKSHVAHILAKITARYDVMLLQEIRDANGQSIKQLLSQVQAINPNFDYVISERLGRSNYKEQYAYFYRTDRVTINDIYQFDDGPDDGSDLFEREPFCVSLKTMSECSEFALCGIHIKPSQVDKELAGLVTVHTAVIDSLKTENIIFMGDFNADCSYLKEAELNANPMYNNETFDWLISSKVDTTTSCGTNCAYDRIVLSGRDLEEAVDPLTAKAFLFDREYLLTPEEAFEVSDHYPVEVSLVLP